MNYSIQRHQSPVGQLYLVSHDDHLCGVIYEKMWAYFKEKFTQAENKETPVLQKTKRQLDEYFAGKRRAFELPLQLHGTDFQKKAWTALAKIPFAETRTYKEQADLIQRPGAARAVGRANGLNPISIVLPCHRVIGSDGSLTGYGGGKEAKRFLLDLELAQRR